MSEMKITLYTLTKKKGGGMRKGGGGMISYTHEARAGGWV
jgi:hypothetical protein